nr:urotensin-2 [Vulpes vulpes]
MYKLISCLLFLGCLHPHFSLPVPDPREEVLQLSVCVAHDGDARLALDELERVSLLQMLLERPGAEREDGLREAGLSTDIANHKGSMRKFQAFSGQDPNIFLSHLLGRIRKPDKKHGPSSECFWKYCV